MVRIAIRSATVPVCSASCLPVGPETAVVQR